MAADGRRGHVSVSRSWLSDERLSDTDLRLMLWLDSHTDSYLNRLSAKSVAEQLGWSRDRVKRSLTSLEDLGLLSSEQVSMPGGGSRTRTKITLHVTAWTEGPVPHDEARGMPHDEARAVPYDEARGMPHGKAPTTSKYRGEESSRELATTPATEVAVVDVWESEFEQFWEAYPRKIGKPMAKTKFKAKAKSMTPEQFDQMRQMTAAWIAHWSATSTDIQFIPHPSTFLNQERFNDMPPTITAPRTSTAMDVITRLAGRDDR